MDIRCVRLTPYRIEGRLLLDVEQLIPLPEAEAMTIRLRRREAVSRGASGSRDHTRFMVITSIQSTEPLPKRRAALKWHALFTM